MTVKVHDVYSPVLKTFVRGEEEFQYEEFQSI